MYLLINELNKEYPIKKVETISSQHQTFEIEMTVKDFMVLLKSSSDDMRTRNFLNKYHYCIMTVYCSYEKNNIKLTGGVIRYKAFTKYVEFDKTILGKFKQ